ncbi:MAG: substrate-binding domain-containing protein [Anaerolineae bacterium]|nr:substrate-binding domain-containing protein [Anaerolineae bacterium]
MTPNSKMNKPTNEQAARAARRPTIGLLGSPLHRGRALWLGAADAARAHNANLICFLGGAIMPDRLANTLLHGALGIESASVLYDLASAQRLDGIVTWAGSGAGMGIHLDQDEMDAFFKRYRTQAPLLPVVNYEKAIQGIPSLFTDTYCGMRELLVHLIEVHSCRRIALIRGPVNHFESDERHRAYLDTLAEYNLPLDPKLVCPPVGWGTERGEEMARLLLDERKLCPAVDWDALATTEIQYAVGAVTTLRARGIHVPGDVAVVGFNDMPEARAAIPAITAMCKPFYESGWKAIEMALDLIQGKPVPEQVSMPAQLIVRRSCGCWPPEVTEIARPPLLPDRAPISSPPPVIREQLVGKKETMGAAIAHNIAPLLPQGQAASITAEIVSRFVDELMAGPDSKTQRTFLLALEDALRKTLPEADGVEQWYLALSTLRYHVLPCLGSHQGLWLLAETMWHQARTVISNEVQRRDLDRNLDAVLQALTLREIGQQLIVSTDLANLMEIIARELPRLKIPGVYLALYENPQPYTYPQAAPEWSRLMLAFDKRERVALDAGGRRFRSKELVPDGLLERNKPYAMVAIPLYFGQQQFGFALIEVGPRNGTIYTELWQRISSSLQALLLQQEREQAERALRESEEKYRTVSEQANDGIVLVQDRLIRYCNPQLGMMLGRPASELIDRPFIDLIAPDHRAITRTRYESRLQGKAVPGRYEIVVQHKDGHEIAVEINASLIEYEERSATLAFVRDINDRKRTEETLREAKERAEEARQTAEKARQEAEKARQEAEEARQTAEAANRAKSVFLANMSHELHTPLNAILGFSELMSHDANLTVKQRDNLKTIEDSGTHLLALINDVLELSRIEAGRTILKEEDVDLYGLLDVLEELFRLRAATKGLALDFERAPDVPQFVRLDENKLRQVLINLLGNACKFTETGRITLRTTRTFAGQTPEMAGAVDRTLVGPPSLPTIRLAFEIEDTGIGIAPEELDAVFDVFVQTASGQNAQQGTGLGVPISREFIHLMGGELEVRSELGQGACFRFEIPAQVIGTSQKPFRKAEGVDTLKQYLDVLFVYEDAGLEGSERVARSLAGQETATRTIEQKMNALPGEWIAAFRDATVLGEYGRQIDLIDQIHDQHLAQALLKLANDFAYDEILALIDGIA